MTDPPAPPRTGAVTVRRRIAAGAADVWDVISTAGILEECHPFCSANPVERWPGVGARDTIRYYGGRVVHRQFIAWRDGEGYDLEVTDANGPVAAVSWQLEDLAPGRSQLAISIRPRMLGGVPPALRWAPRLALVGPMLRRYLRSVLKGIEWRVLSGMPVRRNQFGAHPWFSPRA